MEHTLRDKIVRSEKMRAAMRCDDAFRQSAGKLFV
jgi:hypothetical protein